MTILGGYHWLAISVAAWNMYYIDVDSVNLRGTLQKDYLASSDIEFAFEQLTMLVQAGCRLISIILDDKYGRRMSLPIAAFDGMDMRTDLQSLQRQWETALPDRSNDQPSA